jgi:hypothetical protein
MSTITEAGRNVPMARFEVSKVAGSPVRIPMIESMRGPVMSMGVVMRVRKAMSVMEIAAVCSRAEGWAKAVETRAAVSRGIDLSRGDAEEPGRSEGYKFSQKHRHLNAKPTGWWSYTALSAFSAANSIAHAIKQPG